MTESERFKLLMDYLKANRLVFNDSDFARIVGKGRSYVSECVIGKRTITERFVSSITRVFPMINGEWLLSGEGEMTGGSEMRPSITYGNNAKQREPILEQQRVPLFDIQAAAGIVQIFQGDHAHIPTEYITIPRAPRCDGAMYVSGDSMYPILKSGDIVMYSEIHNMELYLIWGEMYIVAFGDESEDVMVVVKYVQKSDNPEMVRLVSQNQHHADKEIPKSSIRALARVKASIRFQSM